jgi:hypothetical protein
MLGVAWLEFCRRGCGHRASRRAAMAGPWDAGKKRRTRGRREQGWPSLARPRERESARGWDAGERARARPRVAGPHV